MDKDKTDFEAGEKRASYAARARRTYYVLQLMSTGKHRHEIQADCADLFQLSKTAVDHYIKRAKKEALKAATGSNAELMTACVVDLRAIYNKAMQDGKLQIALNARKEMNKVLDIGGKHQPVVQVSIPKDVDVGVVSRGLPDFLSEANG